MGVDLSDLQFRASALGFFEHSHEKFKDKLELHGRIAESFINSRCEPVMESARRFRECSDAFLKAYEDFRSSFAVHFFDDLVKNEKDNKQ